MTLQVDSERDRECRLAAARRPEHDRELPRVDAAAEQIVELQQARRVAADRWDVLAADVDDALGAWRVRSRWSRRRTVPYVVSREDILARRRRIVVGWGRDVIRLIDRGQLSGVVELSDAVPVDGAYRLRSDESCDLG
ncbi:MAG TPA: hypothetical protein VGD80_07865 [Kofleriaceae bacterium]